MTVTQNEIEREQGSGGTTSTGGKTGGTLSPEKVEVAGTTEAIGREEASGGKKATVKHPDTLSPKDRSPEPPPAEPESPEPQPKNEGGKVGLGGRGPFVSDS